jgi:nitrate reductase delta subunit
MKGLGGRQLAVVDQAASVLLQYPDREVLERLPVVRRALDELPSHPARDRLVRFLDHVDREGPIGLATRYVDTFDFRRRSCLYLTYYADGDTRRRGVALAKLKRRYLQAGLRMEPGELPDFLPALLEFTATSGDREVLSEHRPALELLRLALAESGSPYTLVIEALCATLPGPSPRDLQAVRALAAGGPPREEVGLEPYPTPGALE